MKILSYPTSPREGDQYCAIHELISAIARLSIYGEQWAVDELRNQAHWERFGRDDDGTGVLFDHVADWLDKLLKEE